MDLKMTELQESLNYLKIFTESKTCDDPQLISCADVKIVIDEIDRLNKILEGRPAIPTELFQLFVILEKHLDKGDKLKKQGSNWHLFAPNGNGLTSAHSIYGLLMNSKFMKLTASKD